jgi:hypothetical protein
VIHGTDAMDAETPPPITIEVAALSSSVVTSSPSGTRPAMVSSSTVSEPIANASGPSFGISMVSKVTKVTMSSTMNRNAQRFSLIDQRGRVVPTVSIANSPNATPSLMVLRRSRR